MEPTAGATHYEDIYGISQIDSDRVEGYAFDLCEDPEDDEDEEGGGKYYNETPSKRRRMTSGSSAAPRGVIKKPKCEVFHLDHCRPRLKRMLTQLICADKARLEDKSGNEDNTVDLTTEEVDIADPSTWFKIAPRQNSRRSLRVAYTVSEEDATKFVEKADKPPIANTEDSESKRKAEAFSQKKSRQHQLSSSARFELVRKQRLQIREQIHAASEKARKFKERARRDLEVAQGCLVDDDDEALLNRCEPYVLVIKSEALGDYVDFTSLQVAPKRPSKSRTARPAFLDRKAAPMKNWEGEDMWLTPGAAYILIVADE